MIRKWCIAASALLSLIVLIPIAGEGASWWEDKDDLYWQGMITRDQVRFERTWTEGFVRLLGIREGMTVLDIGTGTGRYALAFADMVKDTGTVYATDIVPALVDLLDREAREKGLTNLHPVLVSKEGVDPFYGRQKYDLMTLFHASVIHQSGVPYYRQLREYLADGGRLIVTYQIKFPRFKESDVIDLKGLVGELGSEPDGSPFSAGLRDSTRTLVRASMEGENHDGELRKAVVEDFNTIIEDIQFGGHFGVGMAVRDDLAFTREEKALADWMFLYLKSKGVYDGADLTFGDRKNGNSLNKLILVQRFRKHLAPDVAAPHGHGSHGEGIRDRLLEAGYGLEGIYGDVVPFEITLIFTATP